MDVNGTRFHLLLGQRDWERQRFSVSRAAPEAQPDLEWAEARTSLGLRSRLFHFPAPPGDKALLPQDRRGAGQDRYGNWYWLAEDEAEIRFLGTASREAEHFWSVEDLADTQRCSAGEGAFRPAEPSPLPQPLSLRGLTVTEHHYLIVGVLDPAGLLIFDLHAGGPPLQLLWPEQVPFAPFDIAPAPGGGVWILDCQSADPDYEPRYWALDRYFRVITVDHGQVTTSPGGEDDFQLETESARDGPRCSFPTAITLAMSCPLPGRRPVAIESLPDGTVLILDRKATDDDVRVSRYRFGRQLGPHVSLTAAMVGHLTGLSPLHGHDIAFVLDDNQSPGLIKGALYLATADGNQAYAFRFTADDVNISLTAELLRQYFPMRLYSGKALVAAGGSVYYDLQDRWLPLAKQPRPRYVAQGVLETELFDGREPGCTWHRLFIDACIPSGTAVRIESRAADDPERLPAIAWQPEPPLYRRATGSELPYHQPFAEEERKGDGVGTWELLLQRAQGRFLQLRLTLQGSKRSTPWLRALRVYYPRFSYLKEYLPAAYQADEVSALFIDRFLANVEGTYTVLEGKIEQAQALFDARTAAAEYLDWLAGWFGVGFDREWSEAKRRLFLTHAIELFNQRGTVAGLIRAIRLALDPCPDEILFTQDVTACSVGRVAACSAIAPSVRFAVRIVEQFLTRSTPGVVYGDPTEAVGPGVTTPATDWTPDQGAEPLQRHYRTYLQARYDTPDKLSTAWGETYTSFDQVFLSPVLPDEDTHPTVAADWRNFTRRALGFTYATVTAADEEVYQAFLARRYRHVNRLNDAYQETYETFGAVKLPGRDRFPADGPRLYDWIQFVSVVLPTKRKAHAFTVLVPTTPESDRTFQMRQLDLVRRVVELEKPAHTSFVVKQYWALFRVGEARLGLDTILGAGSRLVALMLGASYLTEGFLASSEPWNVADRIVTGRDRTGDASVL